MTNTQIIGMNGGGTDCSSVLRLLNRGNKKGDVVVIVSDNESWTSPRSYITGTPLANEWETFKARNPRAKLILIDLAPYSTVQAKNQTDVLNVAGFSDNVFEAMSAFIEDGSSTSWVDKIESLVI
jgi:60 kDa SS-A/Ro ribonucleoprotein